MAASNVSSSAGAAASGRMVLGGRTVLPVFGGAMVLPFGGAIVLPLAGRMVFGADGAGLGGATVFPFGGRWVRGFGPGCRVSSARGSRRRAAGVVGSARGSSPPRRP
jgi:hypothetical protein